MNRILRAVWNGPFHIGKLERPVSMGDAVMKVLETAWRAVVLAVAAYAAFIAAIFFMAWREEQRRESRIASIAIDARADFANCPTSNPIRVTIRNRGKVKLARVYYQVNITDPARELGIAPPHFSYLETKKSIEPGSGLTVCLNPNVTPYGDAIQWDGLREGLIISARVQSVTAP